MQQNIDRAGDRIMIVSILIQPEGWMQPTEPHLVGGKHRFQSSSNPKVGCNSRSAIVFLSKLRSFQSSSNPKVGCNWQKRATSAVQPCCFNPHPTRRLDATLICTRGSCQPDISFNPHPTRRLDATQRAVDILLASKRFNPHPTRRLDATLVRLAFSASAKLFQSSSNPKVGCNNKATRTMLDTYSVSILIQPEGWMQLQLGIKERFVARVSILIQPEGWMQPVAR